MLANIEAQRDAAVSLFLETFSWEERKIIMNASYWIGRYNHCVSAGTTRGSINRGILAGSRSALVHESTAKEWQAD